MATEKEHGSGTHQSSGTSKSDLKSKLTNDPQQKKSHKKQKKSSNATGRLMLYLLLGLGVCVLLFMICIYPLAARTSEKEATIRIPRNATDKMVRDTLYKYFDEDYSKAVIKLSKLRGIDLKNRHGMYTIPAGTNAFAAMRRLTSGGQTPVSIRINGFRDRDHMLDLIAHKMEFPADSLKSLLSDKAYMAKFGLTPDNAMALFIDDSYEIYWTSTPRQFLDKIGENYLYLWNPENKEMAEDLGFTPAQIMILASIVDEETNEEREKGTIGRLYINRLNDGMPLQADPTVRFALGNFTIRRINHKDLEVESPYNTYRHKGLPPGPIRTTSFETVNSILRSDPNNYLFMCAKEDFSGTHNFAVSYDEHLKNAMRYQAALDARGIDR